MDFYRLKSDTNVDDSRNEIYSSLSQIPLTTDKKPSPTKYFGMSNTDRPRWCAVFWSGLCAAHNESYLCPLQS